MELRGGDIRVKDGGVELRGGDIPNLLFCFCRFTTCIELCGSDEVEKGLFSSPSLQPNKQPN